MNLFTGFSMITWQSLPFDKLTTLQLYQLLKLRTDVFVVEQACPYPELDNKDIIVGVHHLLGYQNNILVAYARLLPVSTSYEDNVSIGRVATLLSARGTGIGHQLLAKAIEESHKLWPDSPIKIGAQARLEKFYQQYGFVRTSDTYLEDGILHIEMQRQ